MGNSRNGVIGVSAVRSAVVGRKIERGLVLIQLPKAAESIATGIQLKADLVTALHAQVGLFFE